MALGLAIEREMTNQGFTYEVLSTRSGVAENTILAIVKGRANPTLKTLSALSDALGLQLGITLGTSGDADKLLALFRRANDANAARIIAYAEGLLEGHQTEPRPGLKGSN